MSIKIVELKSAVTAHPLRAERIVVSHAGAHTQSVFLTVMVGGADGVRGYGEAATTAIWSGESAQTARRMAEAVFAPRLVGATFDHPREALAEMDRLAWGNPFAKSAIDTAVWDLWARQQDAPAWKLFADRAPARSIPSRASIGAYDAARTVALAREFWASGVRTLKFKVGLPGMDDAARLRAVRDALGDAPAFTVDYNGAFRDAGACVRHVETLLPLRIDLVEQPTHRDRISLMAQVRKHIKAPLLADEAVFTPEHLAEAIDLDAFDLLSIYPGKNGGFTRSLEMAATAAAAGKRCAIGSNLETDLGQAAMAMLAAGHSAFPVRELPCDLASSLFYERSSVTRPLRFEAGELFTPDGPGFSVTPTEVPA